MPKKETTTKRQPKPKTEDPFVPTGAEGALDLEVVNVLNKGCLCNIGGRLRFIPEVVPAALQELQEKNMAKLAGGMVKLVDIVNHGVLVMLGDDSVYIKGAVLSDVEQPRLVHEAKGSATIYAMRVGPKGVIVILDDELEFVPGMILIENPVDSTVKIQ